MQMLGMVMVGTGEGWVGYCDETGYEGKGAWGGLRVGGVSYQERVGIIIADTHTVITYLIATSPPTPPLRR